MGYMNITFEILLLGTVQVFLETKQASLQPGKKFMCQLLVSSLMAEGSLESALETAIQNQINEYYGENIKVDNAFFALYFKCNLNCKKSLKVVP